ncbi:MAG: hypothetical protein ACJATI_003769 [Halioglobus sp.]|jgi:hypothetical protein
MQKHLFMTPTQASENLNIKTNSVLECWNIFIEGLMMVKAGNAVISADMASISNEESQ